MGIIVGIDASRNRSGGATEHLIGVLKNTNPLNHNITKVHLWSYSTLLKAVPDFPWLIKHSSPALEGSRISQARWQFCFLAKEAKKYKCDIMWNTDAGSISNFHPYVAMSRNMLPHEKKEMRRFGISNGLLRYVLLRGLERRSLRKADGVIFLTDYAAKTIQQTIGSLPQIKIIPHGVGTNFRQTTSGGDWPAEPGRTINCVYVSNASMYKHQWHVIRAIANLRKKGYNLSLLLAGGGKGKAQKIVSQEMKYSDPSGKFVKQISFVKHAEIPGILASADVFIFASSCENMPNTLVEAMASGLTIACSDRGPMPEVLQDGGIYFNPEKPESIAEAIEKIITDKPLRLTIAKKARQLSEQYSWERCASESWNYLCSVVPQMNYQICTNCVMDTSDSSISFDKDGVCDHCNTFYRKTLPAWNTDEKGMKKLKQIVKNIKKEGQGKDFDCIIGMSGGIDSSYLTYVAKEKLGLRPLVFHVDAGWNSQQAVNNIERLVDILGLDLFTEVIDWEEMRDLQLAFFKSGVPHIDAPQDHAYFATLYNFAEKHDIKHILTGANYSTECIRNPVEWMYYQSDIIQLKDIHKKFGKSPLKKFPLTNILRHKIYLPYFKGIKVVTPLNYIPYVKEEAMQILVDKFGWQSYSQKHFESRFTKFYEGYWLPEKFGYDTRKVQYSSLILTQQMTRDEALGKLKNPPYDKSTIAQDFEYVATKLGIKVDELQRYFDAPNKTYKDYKSQGTIFSLGAKVMKFLMLENAGKR